MKRIIFKHISLALVVIFFGICASAQQKVSDRPFPGELKKIEQMKQARTKTLRETQQPSDKGAPSTSTPVVEKPKQQPAVKPSSQPMTIPARSRKS